MTVKPAYDGVIFDLDGTLVHSAPDLLESANHVLSLSGRPGVDMAVIERGVSFGAIRMMQEAFTATGGCDGIDLQEKLPIFLAYYEANIAATSHLYEGVMAFFEQAQAAGLPLGICTNKSEHLARKLLDSLGVSPFVKALTGGNTFEVKKPHPDHITRTRDRMGLTDSHRLLMVGDSTNDIRAAQAAGWDSVIVSFGYSDCDISTLGATYKIDHFTQLSAIVHPSSSA